MNFLQMHERLRLELLRRIQRGTLSVSLLARQAGFAQAHMSNFLRNRRQLSMAALDRVLTSQHMTILDLLPANSERAGPFNSENTTSVPVISHAAALFEPYIRASSIRFMLPLPAGLLASVRARSGNSRKGWERWVAVSVTAIDALPMEPVVLPDAIVLLDRHYVSLIGYRPNRPNLYAVRNGNRLVLRYVDFLMDRVVLRPHNLTFPVDLLQVAPGEAPSDLVAGRVAFVLNEL